MGHPLRIRHWSTAMAETGEIDLSVIKDGGCTCLALFCANCTCLPCTLPFIAGHAKVCCCALQLQSQCPCISLNGADCYNEEQGCCQAIVKLCCIFVELQYPPSRSDIGCGLCGCVCCNG